MSLEQIDISGFKPAELMDQPQPMMIWASLSDLVIDRQYQRSITSAGRAAIQRIADGFDWRKYQPILVAPTDGGRMAIVDGQHRAHAALLCGIKKLPAMTVAMTPREQAAGFAAINRDRISMNPLSIYRAELAAGSDWAQQVKMAVEEAGCVIATSSPSQKNKRPKTIYAVSLIRRMIASGEAAAVTTGLRAIADSAMQDDVGSYNGMTLAIWLGAISSDQRFAKLDLSAMFEAIDFDTLQDACRARSRVSGTPAKKIATDHLVSRLKEQIDGAPHALLVAQ